MRYHYARLNYQFKKLRAIREGIEIPEWGGNTEFELYAFFEICYHLKDWIKFGPEYDPSHNVEHFVNKSTPLSICTDICNKLKHRILTNKLRSKSLPSVFQITSVISISTISGHSTVKISEATIETERGKECAFQLAEDCMNEWMRYFSEATPVKVLI